MAASALPLPPDRFRTSDAPSLDRLLYLAGERLADRLPAEGAAITPSLRKSIETAIETLIGVLDRLDGDPDLEDSDEGE